MPKIPILIDCDPGVDDSFAIALANACPDFELVALTPVEGNVPASLTRRNALGLCDLLDLDCRVAFGAEKPLRRAYDRDASHVHGASGVGSVVFDEIRKQPDPQPAWEVIYEEAVRRKGEMVLFTVGPLTNLATCLRLHPDLPKYIKRYIMMGGGTFGNVGIGRRAEFNIWVDPTAAKEVFEQMDVWMVGLNATHAAALSLEDFDEMVELCGDSEKAYLLRELSRFCKQNCMENGSDNNVIHDALAVAAAIDPAVITFEDHHVRVEDSDDAENIGETVIDTSGTLPANCHVAMAVDQPRFVRMIKDMCRWYANR